VGNISTAAFFQKSMDGFTADLLQRFLFCRQKEKEKVNIGVVGRYCVFRKAFFRDQIVEKDLFCRSELL